MPEIGQITTPTEMRDALSRARERARLLPDCLVDARRIARTVIAGWHGRRQRGIGENFWQFRPFVSGDSITGIDWRRSARDDHTYVREREWEAAHTVWLWVDLSASMLYKSSTAIVSKESRALVLMLAFAEIIARSGERIGIPGIIPPRASRNAAEIIAHALYHHDPTGLPESADIKGPSDLVLIGDFLDPIPDILARLGPIASRGITGHVVEITDPAEEAFPYSGRTEFIDPETGERVTAGRAETLSEAYRAARMARRQELADGLKSMGWNLVTHRTDRLASEALVALHGFLSASRDRRGAVR